MVPFQEPDLLDDDPFACDEPEEADFEDVDVEDLDDLHRSFDNV